MLRLPGPVLPVGGASPPAAEPIVTPEESRWLERAQQMAMTNRLAALRFLEERNSPQASAAMDFAMGHFHLQHDDPGAAEEAYRAALEKFPDFMAAAISLGRTHLLQEAPEKAVALYQGMLARGRVDPDLYLLLAHALLMKGHPVSAETALRQALLLLPGWFEAKHQLAQALLLQERYPEALSLTRELLQQRPADSALWQLRIQLLLATGQYPQAARAIECARRLSHISPEMLALLGDLLIRKQQPEDALRAYEAAFLADPPDAALLLRAAEGLLMLEDIDGARHMLARADEHSDSLDRASRHQYMRLRAALARLQGQPDEAAAWLEDLLGHDPLNAAALLLLARLQWEAGLFEEALLYGERAARISGHEADALLLQALVEIDRERYAQAARLLEAAQAFEERPHVTRYLEQIRRLTP